MKSSRIAVGFITALVLVFAGELPAIGLGTMVSVSISTLNRNQNNGYLDFDINVTGSDYRSTSGESICGTSTNCYFRVQAMYAASPNNVVELGEIRDSNGWDYPITKNFTGSRYLAQIVAVRGVIDGAYGDVTTDWIPVDDPYVQPEVDVTINSIGRNPTNGYLDFDIDITASYYRSQPDGACRTYTNCYYRLQAMYASDPTQIVELAERRDPNTWNYPATQNFVGSRYLGQIIAVRGVIDGAYGDITSDWVSVDDPYVQPEVDVTINSIGRNPTNGYLDFDIDITASYYRSQPDGACRTYTNCYYRLQAMYASDPTQIVELAERRDPNTWNYPATQNFVGSRNINQIIAVRGVIDGAYGNVPTPWIPVSENVSNGHDLDATLALALAAMGSRSSLEGCVSLFPIGTHTMGSSVNDQQAECLAATQGGQSFAAFLASYLKGMSKTAITQLLVNAGVMRSQNTSAISPYLDYGQPLPQGCVWVGIRAIECGTTTYTPISAPPVQDPVQENNLKSKLNQNNPTLPPIILDPFPTEGPLANATDDEIRLEALRQCVKTLGTVDLATNSTWATLAGITADDPCSTMPVYFSGGDVAEATQHDLDVLLQHPEYLLLHYVKNSEHTADPARPAPQTIPACAGMDSSVQQCDEFPFYSVDEGLSTAPPDYRAIPILDNRNQGIGLREFYRTCEPLQKSERGSPDRAFLHIPLPFLPVSFGLCESKKN